MPVALCDCPRKIHCIVRLVHSFSGAADSLPLTTKYAPDECRFLLTVAGNGRLCSFRKPAFTAACFAEARGVTVDEGDGAATSQMSSKANGGHRRPHRERRMCNRHAQGTPDTRPSSGGHRVAAEGALLPGHGLLTRKLGDLRQGGDGSSSSEGRPAGGLSGLQRHA